MSSPPPPYTRQANFTSFEASNPSKPKSGASLDGEFNAVKASLDGTQSRLSELQRDDGSLANGVVSNDSLDEGLQQVVAIVQGDVSVINDQVDAAEAAAGNAAVSASNAQSYMNSALSFAQNALASQNAASASAGQAATSASNAAASLASLQAAGGIGTTQLADNSVTNAKMADNAINTAEIVNGAVTHLKVANGMAVDRAYAEYTANADLTATIPADDTIPQNTEGTQILSATITPKSTTNRIRVRFQGAAVSSLAGVNIITALFRDGVANALSAAIVSADGDGANYHTGLALEFEHVPGVTTAVTYSIRVGPHIAATLRMNGSTTSRQLGGAARATLILEEIKA